MSDDARPAASRVELDHIEANVDEILATLSAEYDAIAAIERGEPGQRRWYVRMGGEEKAHFSIWFHLDQRNLHFSTYFMPYPDENQGETFAFLLRKAAKIIGAGLVIGAEDALYWQGALRHAEVSAASLDAVIGTLYEVTETCFRGAMRLGFASRFHG